MLLKKNLNRGYHIYLAHIGSVTSSIHTQMGFNLHSCYLYNQIKLPEGCLRELRNINVCSNYMCDSIPDGLLETIQNLCMRKHPDSGCVYVLHKNVNWTYTSLSLKYFFLRHMISVIRQNLTVRVPEFWEQRYSYESLLPDLHGMGASTERVQEWNEEMKNDIELRNFRNTPLSWNRCSLPFSNSRVTIPTI